jgi:trehalose-phosphatase
VNDHAELSRAVVDALAPDRTLLLLADYDGTLAPVVSDPRDAWLSPRMLRALGRLAAARRARVVVLSGRSVEDLHGRIGLPDVIYAGCHGLEIEGPDLSFRHPAADLRRPAIREIARTLQQEVASIPGVFVDARDLAVGVYYRDVPRHRIGALEMHVERTVDRQPGMRVVAGRRVVEVLPTLGWDKGQCAVWIHGRLQAADTAPLAIVYLGGDGSDETAFAVLPSDALTVRVGFGPSAARYRLEDLDAVERFLSSLPQALAENPACD